MCVGVDVCVCQAFVEHTFVRLEHTRMCHAEAESLRTPPDVQEQQDGADGPNPLDPGPGIKVLEEAPGAGVSLFFFGGLIE